MNEEIKTRIAEVQKVKKNLEKIELSILYDFLKTSTLQTIDVDIDYEYNDEGGNYTNFNITHLNGKYLEDTITEDFFSYGGIPDWFCSFCLENNIKQTDVENFCEIFYDFLPDEIKKRISYSTITLEYLEKLIQKV